MKCGVVYFKDVKAGVLAKFKNGSYEFRYLKEYVVRHDACSISATISKGVCAHYSRYLFPFFHGLIAEGVQKEHQCRMLKIDERDYFSRLLATSKHGAIGAVYVEARTKRK